MELHLDDNDISKISTLIASDYNGTICYNEADFEVYFECKAEVEGYYEDSYDNGTGAYNITDVELSIIDVYVPGSDIKVVFDETKLIRLAESKISA